MKRDDKYTYDWEAMKRIVAVLLLLASRIDGLAKAGLAPDIRLFCRFLQAEQATREFVADMIFDAQYPLAELACPEEIDAYTFARDQNLPVRARRCVPTVSGHLGDAADALPHLTLPQAPHGRKP